MRFILPILFSVPAFAQDAGVVLPDAAGDTDVAALAKTLLDAIQSKNWWLLAAVVVILLVWLLRTQLPKFFPKAGEFLQHPVVSLALPILVATAGGLMTAAAAGPINPTIVIGVALAGLKVGMGSIAGYVGAKKVAEAKEAGEVAAGEVKTIGDAKAVFSEPTGKGPQP